MTLGVTDLKRWLAALCVALIAFVTIEQYMPGHLATDLQQGSLSYNIMDADAFAADAAPAAPDDDHSGAPAPSAHHCCCAHAPAVPSANAVAALSWSELDTPILRDIDGAPLNAPLGLDRPPKYSAIA